MDWKTILSFIIGATLLTLLSGWLMAANLLQIQTQIAYSEAELGFVKIWIQIAIVIGLLLPVIAFLVWIHNPNMRTIFGGYLLVMVIQIVTEQICSRIFSPSLLLIIGTIYTTFRIWQLTVAKQKFLTVNPQNGNVNFYIAYCLLWLMLVFWSANLIFLLVVGWLRIL
ncbi:hypothetical protein QUA43_17410 [Microcoleus sp. N9_B4]|uniref:DUF7733 domain-containing protein n=1 Tax=Microcoleus sp. N9_B4 TaxID=3055386 RepID=UPI002FD5D0E2